MTPASSYFNLFDYFLGEGKLAQIGNRTAIEFRGRQISYRDLRDETEQWATRLTACGVTEGDRIALLLFDSPEFIACFQGVSLFALIVEGHTGRGYSQVRQLRQPVN